MIGGGAPGTSPPPNTNPTAIPSLVVSIDASGSLLVGAEVVKDADLEARLRKVDKAQSLVVRPAAGVPHARVVFVLDTAKKAGLTKLAIGAPTKAPPTKIPPITTPAK